MKKPEDLISHGREPAVLPMRGFQKGSWFCVVSVLTVLLAFGCHKTFKINVTGDDTCNGGYPVVLRIYQLSSPTNFELATAQSLWSKNSTVLEPDIVAEEELTLRPGETRPVELKLAKETKFIAACADFHNPDADGWRQIYPRESLEGEKVWISCDNSRLEIVKK